MKCNYILLMQSAVKCAGKLRFCVCICIARSVNYTYYYLEIHLCKNWTSGKVVATVHYVVTKITFWYLQAGFQEKIKI